MSRPECSVYTMSMDGLEGITGTACRLNAPGYFIQPMITDAGDRVVFWGREPDEAGFNIWAADPDGGNLTRLTDDRAINGHPFWSADGEAIIFFSSVRATPQTEWIMARQFELGRSSRHIWLMDRDGGNRRQVTSGAHVDERPCLAPDGRTIVFVSDRSGHMNLWQVASDGAGLRQITDHAGLDYRPIFSPDGQYLAWFTDNNPAGIHNLAIRRWPDGEVEFPLSPEAFKWVHGPQWLPDGRTILVHAWLHGQDRNFLFAVDLQTGSFRRLLLPEFEHYGHGTFDRSQTVMAFDSKSMWPRHADSP